MSHRCSVFSCIFGLVLLCVAGCSSPQSAVTTVLKNFCRSRVEGDYSSYVRSVGGQLLVTAVRDQGFKQRFQNRGEQNHQNGIFFTDITITDATIGEHSATVRFEEHQASGSRIWLNRYQATLEYIDGRWRVIGLR